MTSLHLVALYLGVGAVAAFFVARRAEGTPFARAASACVALVLWPLWAPIALGPADRRPVRGGDRHTAELHGALDGVIAAAAGSTFETLLSADAAARIRLEIDRAATRIAQLTDTLGRPGFDPSSAEARLVDLERAGASARAIATARLHRDGVARLARVRDQDRLALEELADALGALRGQIVLARVAGPGGDDIVSDLWARVEGLGAAFADEASTAAPSTAEENMARDVVGSTQEARA